MQGVEFLVEKGSYDKGSPIFLGRISRCLEWESSLLISFLAEILLDLIDEIFRLRKQNLGFVFANCPDKTIISHLP